jgi:hypothetical protein
MFYPAAEYRLPRAEYTQPVAMSYDVYSSENEVVEQIPSLRCVLSGRLMYGAVHAEDGYSYDLDAWEKYIQDSGKRKADSRGIFAPSPRTGERMDVGNWCPKSARPRGPRHRPGVPGAARDAVQARRRRVAQEGHRRVGALRRREEA